MSWSWAFCALCSEGIPLTSCCHLLCVIIYELLIVGVGKHFSFWCSVNEFDNFVDNCVLELRPLCWWLYFRNLSPWYRSLILLCTFTLQHLYSCKYCISNLQILNLVCNNLQLYVSLLVHKSLIYSSHFCLKFPRSLGFFFPFFFFNFRVSYFQWLTCHGILVFLLLSVMDLSILSSSFFDDNQISHVRLLVGAIKFQITFSSEQVRG